jgi:3-phytase
MQYPSQFRQLSRASALFVAACLCALGLGMMADRTVAQSVDGPPAAVYAQVETAPVRHGNDAADDSAIWIHPSDPALSTIIATDKHGGLLVYDLGGRQLQYLPIGNVNNVDLRYNVPLGGELVTLVVAGNQQPRGLEVYKVDPASRKLVAVRAGRIALAVSPYGLCLYRSAGTGSLYAFVTKNPYPLDDPRANNGEVQQYELYEQGGAIAARQVRSFEVGSDSEGCVADDITGDLFVAQTNEAIWKYGAEPEAGSRRTRVARVGAEPLSGGQLEGLALYYSGERTGYLIVSQQCCAEFVVFRREAPHAFVLSFTIVDSPDGLIDDVTGTDGIEVSNAALGPGFAQGLFVAHDTRNEPRNSAYTNFKLVPWESIAQAGAPALTIATSWDPRALGAPEAPPPNPTGGPAPSPEPGASPTPTAHPTSTATPPPELAPELQGEIWLPLLAEAE